MLSRAVKQFEVPVIFSLQTRLVALTVSSVLERRGKLFGGDPGQPALFLGFLRCRCRGIGFPSRVSCPVDVAVRAKAVKM